MQGSAIAKAHYTKEIAKRLCKENTMFARLVAQNRVERSVFLLAAVVLVVIALWAFGNMNALHVQAQNTIGTLAQNITYWVDQGADVTLYFNTPIGGNKTTSIVLSLNGTASTNKLDSYVSDAVCFVGGQNTTFCIPSSNISYYTFVPPAQGAATQPATK
jgi:hypothetical protein